MFEDVCDLTHVAKSAQRKKQEIGDNKHDWVAKRVAEVGQLISTKPIKIN